MLSNFANATTYTETKGFIDKGNGVYAYENFTETSIFLGGINELGSQLRRKGASYFVISAPQATITSYNDIVANGGENSLGFTISAKELLLSPYLADASMTISQPSTINANLTLQGGSLEVRTGIMKIYDNNLEQTMTFNGSLKLNGNLSTQGAQISNVAGGVNRGRIIVSGKSNITNTSFSIISNDFQGNTQTKVLVLTSNGGITLGGGNTASFWDIHRDITMLEKTYDFEVLDKNSKKRGAMIGYGGDIFGAKLKLERNNLYAMKAVGEKTLKELKSALIDMDIDAIYAELFEIGAAESAGIDSGYSQSEKTKLQELKARLESLKTQVEKQTDTQIAKEYNEKYGNQAGDMLLSALQSKNQDIKDSAGAIIGSDLFFGYAKGAIQENVNTAKQTLQNSYYDSAITVQNMQTQMAILERVSRFSNPFQNIRYALNTAKASVEDSASKNDALSQALTTNAYFRESLQNNFWANVFGGANIIGQNSGALYGINAGYDRDLGVHFVGGYISYAYSTIKDTNITQNSNNLQFGGYARLVFEKNEVDIKAFGQVAITKQNRYVVSTQNEADFARGFVGVSGTYGYIFTPHKMFVAKPLIGLNLYYNHTPKYSENGDLALEINAINSVNISLDFGADLRGYWNADSFFYITPKFEQYVLVKGGDFVSAFVGSPTTFSISSTPPLKTYLQTIVGADIGVYNGVTITLSAGVKQIIAGKIQDKNETFVSGNLGVRYRF
ncbi:autotransporter outer membrane beta-barrel domain-containing protein [Helicobacter sp. MIT 01-3238]|uniref:autotransporter outer membrane beta-barrel domain-containing protein n=1 Tax=Helicobacter sp. MIT 01-3238 TaxID=398627 RepID=UPI000E1F947F|nr:autotransporter outer membrane beta-barrel domain-containing protein [Helicobacter sp. MIT 01-3238]RDU53810.1 hypothetical protein CQA40_04480 [Helicobacter sp. MIT 01-3238]